MGSFLNQFKGDKGLENNQPQIKSVDKNTTDSVGSGKKTDKIKYEDVKAKLGETGFQHFVYLIDSVENTKSDKLKKEAKKIFGDILNENDLIKLSYLGLSLQKIVSKYEKKKKEAIGEAQTSSIALSTSTNVLDDTISLLGENVETLGEMYNKIGDSFGETGTDILENWKVNSEGDVEVINAIFATVGDVAGLAILDMIWEIGVVDLGVKIGLKDIAFLLKNGILIDYELFKSLSGKAFDKHDGSSITLLALFLVAHINYGVGAWLRFRDYIVTMRGDKDSKAEQIKEKKKITDDKGKITYEEKMVDSKMKKLFGKYYLDPVDKGLVIFDVKENIGSGGTTENLGAKANEYIKRKKSSKALELFFYDNPKVLNELKLIEMSSLQSDTPRYWRRTWRVLESHGFTRTFISRAIIPEYFKGEKESFVLDFIVQKQEEQKKTVELLYETNSDGSINVEKQSKFLKGLYSSINNNPNLTKSEKEYRISNLEKLLNQVTSNRLIDKERLVEELYRTTEGYLTKIEKLGIVQEEIDKIDKEGKEFSKLKWVKNKILLKKHHLIRLKNRIAGGDFDGINKEGLKTEIDRTINSKVIHFGEKHRLKFPKIDEFITEIEDKYGKIESLLKLYDIKDIRNFENYIKYILPGLEATEMEKILKQFSEAKTPYDKISFYEELNRIKEGFLPSNQLLEKLVLIREGIIKELEKGNNIKTGKIKRIIKQIKRIKIEIINREEFKTLNEAQKHHIEEFFDKLSNDLKDGISLNELSKRTLELNRINYEYFRNKIPNIKISLKDFVNEEGVNVNEKIEFLDKIIELTREGKLNITKEEIKEIKNNPKVFFENIDSYISEDFTETEQKALIEEFKRYEGLEAYDYKESLGNPSSYQEINNKLLEKFKTELIYIDLLNEGGESFGNIKAELSEFAKIISKNDLTIGQASKIEIIILRGQKLNSIDIDYITNNTVDHSLKLDNKIILIRQLRVIFEGNDETKKDRIIKYIEDNKDTIDKSKLPDFIRNYEEEKIKALEDIKKQEEKNKLVETQKGVIQKRIDLIDSRKNISQLDILERDLLKYIEQNNIDVESAEFKDLMVEFEGEYNRKYVDLDNSTKNPASEEKNENIERQKAELERITNDLLSVKDIRSLNKLKTEFNSFIQIEKISRISPEFKSLIEIFELKYNAEIQKLNKKAKKAKKPKKEKTKINPLDGLFKSPEQRKVEIIKELRALSDEEFEKRNDLARRKAILYGLLHGEKHASTRGAEDIAKIEMNSKYENVIDVFIEAAKVTEGLEGFDYEYFEGILEDKIKEKEVLEKIERAGKTNLKVRDFIEKFKKYGKEFVKEFKKHA